MTPFKIDMHVHTSDVSWCAHIPGQEIPGYYLTAGYQGIVITDHYLADYFDHWGDIPWKAKIDHFLAGYRAAREAGSKKGLTVYLGVELRMDQDKNDYLLYGADQDFLENHPALYQLELGKLKQLAGQHGALLFQAHPFRYGEDVAKPEVLHGVEVFNGNVARSEQNQRALDFARNHGLCMVSGSDFHDLNNLGKGGLEFAQPIPDNRVLVQALRDGTAGRIIGY
jgi:hypothetical protein